MKKIMVALSGGVDSAAAAILLRQQGYAVGGCTLLLRDGGEAEAADARLAAEQLGIPFTLLDLRAEFRRDVIDYFVATYRAGGTPNPCVVCNRTIKFGRLLDYALAQGYDGMATGHYLRLLHERGRYIPATAAFAEKDQTYVLCELTQEQLAHCVFPLGEMQSKDAVRALVAQAGLSLAKKHDSQDICFIPDGDYFAYLTANGVTPQPGCFLRPDGTVLGPHRGMEAYTVGQRRGLGMAFGARLCAGQARRGCGGRRRVAAVFQNGFRRALQLVSLRAADRADARAGQAALYAANRSGAARADADGLPAGIRRTAAGGDARSIRGVL